MFKLKSTKVFALIINTRSVGETDRIITLICQELGKIKVLAKGVRKSTSTAVASLQAGNLVEGLVVHTKGWPIFAQVMLKEDIGKSRENLRSVKEIMQVLEMVDALFVEEEIDPQLFDQVLKLRELVIKAQKREIIVDLLGKIIERLGFPLSAADNQSLSSYIETLSDRKLKSYQYLTLKS